MFLLFGCTLRNEVSIVMLNVHLFCGIALAVGVMSESLALGVEKTDVFQQITSESEGAETGEEVIELVLTGWRHNFDAFSIVKGELELVRYNSLKALEAIGAAYKATKNNESGLSPMPKDKTSMKISVRFIIEGPNMRFEGSFVDPNVLRVVNADKQSRYDPNARHLQIVDRATDSGGWRDPKQPFYEESRRLEEVLGAGKFIASQMDSGVLTLSVVSSTGSTIELRFDSTMNMLPISCLETNRKDGRDFSTHLSYKKHTLDDVTFWYPTEIGLKSWSASANSLKTNEDDLGTGWLQYMLYKVSKVEFLDAVPNGTFEIDPANGTFVADPSNDRWEWVGEAPTTEHSENELKDQAKGAGWIGIGISTLAVVILSCLVYAKRKGEM